MQRNPIDVTRTMGYTTKSDLALHNMNILDSAERNQERYRIRHGILNGEKVAVVMPVVTFTDLFFSYWPSRRSLKHLFKRCCIIEMAPKTLECIQKEQDYLSQNVYNPWPGLLNDIDTTKYNATGETLLAADAKSGKHITFYEKEAPNYIFTNMYQRKGQQLVVIDMPDVVSMAPCSEIHFQAGKFHSSPTIRKDILDQDFAKDALNIAHPLDANRPPVDKNFYTDNRDRKLMLKLERTRAQQDPVFRKALLKTAPKNIYALSPHDQKWGCTAVTNASGDVTHHCGENLLGRILMMVRDEVINNKITEKSAAEVRSLANDEISL